MVVLSDIIKAAVFRKEMIVSQVSFEGKQLMILNMSSFTTCHHQTGKMIQALLVT